MDQIIRHGRAEDPNEACGIVTPDSRVTRLPNRSLSPTDSYEIAPDDLVHEIQMYCLRKGVEPSQLTPAHFVIWHTHPGGVVGPSKGDFTHRLPDFQYVVITLPGGEATRF